MKILIISDTHLTDKFDSVKHQYLLGLIQKTDKIIINGDFWDSWHTNFENFINSEWNDLFPLLLQKETVYIFGNHDPETKCDERVKLFSKKAVNKYSFQLGNQVIKVEHGHNLLNTRNGIALQIYNKFVKLCEQRNISYVLWFLLFTEKMGFKIFGKRLMTQSKFAKNNNKKIKEIIRTNWLICGDTHCPEIDYHNHFANSGCILYGYSSYILIEQEEIKLMNQKYKSTH